MTKLPEPAAHLADYMPVYSESQVILYAKQYARDVLEEAAKVVLNANLPADDRYIANVCAGLIRAMKGEI